MGITTSPSYGRKWSSWNLTHKHHFFGPPVWHMELAPLGLTVPPAVEAWHLNPWTTEEVQGTRFQELDTLLPLSLWSPAKHHPGDSCHGRVFENSSSKSLDLISGKNSLREDAEDIVVLKWFY